MGTRSVQCVCISTPPSLFLVALTTHPPPATPHQWRSSALQMVNLLASWFRPQQCMPNTLRSRNCDCFPLCLRTCGRSRQAYFWIPFVLHASYKKVQKQLASLVGGANVEIDSMKRLKDMHACSTRVYTCTYRYNISIDIAIQCGMACQHAMACHKTVHEY